MKLQIPTAIRLSRSFNAVLGSLYPKFNWREKTPLGKTKQARGDFYFIMRHGIWEEKLFKTRRGEKRRRRCRYLLRAEHHGRNKVFTKVIESKYGRLMERILGSDEESRAREMKTQLPTAAFDSHSALKTIFRPQKFRKTKKAERKRRWHSYLCRAF